MFRLNRIVVGAALALLLSVTSSCGGGGGGGGGGAAAALVGNYALTGFTFYYDTGSVVTQSDVGSFFGTSILRSDGTYSQTVQINGSTQRADAGTWTADGSSLYFTSTIVSCSGAIGYVLTGTTWLTNEDHQCGQAYREVDTWVRTP